MGQHWFVPFEDEDKHKGLDSTYLHFDIQNADQPLLSHVLDSPNARAVIVAGELSMLNKASVFHQLQETLLGHKVVVLSVCLACSWGSSRVCVGDFVRKLVS
jgi:hypothetical protein